MILFIPNIFTMRLSYPNQTILPPTDPTVYIDSATEPQYVTRKEPVSGWVYLNSLDTPYGTDRSNCQLGLRDTLVASANRMRMLGVTVNWYIPNVNPRNDTITFTASTTGLDYTVTLATKFYDVTIPADVTQLVTDIVAALNGAGSGLTFSAAPIAGFPRMYTITSVGGTYRFVKTCSAIAKGIQMYDFDQDQTFALTHTLGPMNMMYTQFVDIKSTTLTKWEKIRSVTTGHQNPVVFRAYVGGNKWGPDFSELHHYLAFSWKWNEPIYTIDISFFDQNGDPLFVPNGGKDFIWQIALAAEL